MKKAIKISISLPKDLYKEISFYIQTKNYASISEFFRAATRIWIKNEERIKEEKRRTLQEYLTEKTNKMGPILLDE
ncbi:MAG: hypothetical protein RL094_130 [Candidatus Parcubacteria bacterium]|jgi:metal-responsive CopG/Arc/MetJ family transcriptional regulator